MAIEGIKSKITPDDVGLYVPDDIPAFVEKYKKRMERKPRKRRTDLVKGGIVVVLEGAFASKRVVYLRNAEDYLAVCAGPKSVNGVPFFKIDEKYLFATSTALSFDADTDIDHTNIYESVRMFTWSQWMPR